MSVSDWQAFISQTDARMGELRGGIPGVAKGFHEVARAAIKAGALDSKTKELMALAIGIAARCDGCLAYHSKAAAKYGATREEVMETIGVAVYMGGGPSMIYGAEALAAFDAFFEG
ncbi:carboxymuconolactone decarboxylase family protein [Roseibium litorale]|uniref:Carboxymuconolactone decarboxylase family protein n=1 Tax=Roseibium litorale TaxID=2803841 RepID=A0ABR9CLS2_9HYPH|nr:carboxymuconolactone decarboxylase family protein [Roseibium litorale]MBD8891815.1 carboxymuconolactone decarboxylase family protein [Roseibium litorale]